MFYNIRRNSNRKSNRSCHENSHAVCCVTLPYSLAGAYEIVRYASFEEMNSDSYVTLILTSLLGELRREKIHSNPLS